MLSKQQRTIIRHALIIIFLGLVGGFCLLFSVLGVISLSPLPFNIDYQLPGTPAQWRAVHVGNITNGLMAIVFAILSGHLALSDKAKTFVTYGLVATIWGNALFYIFGIFTPNRGLSLSDNSVGEANWAAIIAFGPAFIVAFILMAITVVLFRAVPKE